MAPVPANNGLGRAATLSLASALVAVTSSCTTPEPKEVDGNSWPSSSSPVDADGLVWADDGEVHLPDGSTLDTGGPAGAYVVAGPGVWFAAAGPDGLEGNELPALRLATADGVEETGAHPHTGSLSTTSDGRWLAFLDRLDSLVAHDLSTGEVVSSDLDWDAIRSSAWYRSLHPTGPLWNDDRTWQIPTGDLASAPVLVSADGQRVTTSVATPHGPLGSPGVTGPPLEDWRLGGWIHPKTVVATSPSRDGFDVDWDAPVLLTCAVPSGECTVVEGTEDGVNLPADRPFGLPSEAGSTD